MFRYKGGEISLLHYKPHPGGRLGGYPAKLGLDEDLIDGRPSNPDMITLGDPLSHRLPKATHEEVSRCHPTPRPPRHTPRARAHRLPDATRKELFK